MPLILYPAHVISHILQRASLRKVRLSSGSHSLSQPLEVPSAVGSHWVVVSLGCHSSRDDSGLGWQGLPRESSHSHGFPHQHSFVWPDEGKIGWESIGDSGTHLIHPHLSTFEEKTAACPPREISGWCGEESRRPVALNLTPSYCGRAVPRCDVDTTF